MARTGSRGRGGRPALPPAERRRPLTLVWATPWEGFLVAEKADAVCLPLSRYLLLAGLQRHIPAPVSRIDLATLGQLAALGNNLNQAVHLLHMGQLSPELGPSLAAVQALLEQIRRELRSSG
jgi:hypothetical protein